MIERAITSIHISTPLILLLLTSRHPPKRRIGQPLGTKTGLELDDKSTGRSPPPTDTQKSGQEEDIAHEDREKGDTPGSPISMDEVYGDHIHQNPGTHLNGGITDDALWQV